MSRPHPNRAIDVRRALHTTGELARDELRGNEEDENKCRRESDRRPEQEVSRASEQRPHSVAEDGPEDRAQEGDPEDRLRGPADIAQHGNDWQEQPDSDARQRPPRRDPTANGRQSIDGPMIYGLTGRSR